MRKNSIQIHKIGKSTAILLFTMVYSLSFGQNSGEFRSGVYEYTSTDAPLKADSSMELKIDERVSRRELILQSNTDKIVARYIIRSGNSMPWAVMGMFGEYLFDLKKKNNNLYKAKTEDIEVSICTVDENKIEVEVFGGTIDHYYSGGIYFAHKIPLLPEKYTLIFIRELTAEDEERLKL